MKRSKVALFHPGTQHSWQTALALQQLGRLAFFATSIFYKPGQWPYRLERLPGPLGRRLGSEFRRFAKPELDPGLVHTSGAIEWLERIAARLGRKGLAHWLDRIGNRRFASNLGALLQGSDQAAVWGYSGSSASSFALAKTRGLRCILDRTVGDFRTYNRIMDEVAQDYAAWMLPTIRRFDDATIAGDEEEYALADVILGGSQFVIDTIVAESAASNVAAKLRVLPYCFDEALFAGAPAPRPVERGEPVRFLFNGAASARKGIHLALEAIARIPPSAASLTIVGDLQVPAEAFAPYRDRVTHVPAVPRADIPAIMARHDVLLFPSYFEGSALSLLEGLASGMALIQSRNSGNGVTPATGILLDRIDTDAVHAAMMTPVEDRALLDSWRAAAQGQAANYSFARYRDNIAALLEVMELQHPRRG